MQMETDRSSLLGGERPRWAPSQARIARRHLLVATAKRLLPLVAVGLLASVALWPELSRDTGSRRLGLQRGTVPETGDMSHATYHGVDERGRPYTLTATTAHEMEPGRIDLTAVKGDIASAGTGPSEWGVVRARRGVYMQHLGNLDLSGDVQLYRDDGTTLATESANFDLKSGAGSGAEMVHVEGPFGTLDAQGFTATDRGAVLRFAGPGRLVLNAKSR